MILMVTIGLRTKDPFMAILDKEEKAEKGSKTEKKKAITTTITPRTAVKRADPIVSRYYDEGILGTTPGMVKRDKGEVALEDIMHEETKIKRAATFEERIDKDAVSLRENLNEGRMAIGNYHGLKSQIKEWKKDANRSINEVYFTIVGKLGYAASITAFICGPYFACDVDKARPDSLTRMFETAPEWTTHLPNYLKDGFGWTTSMWGAATAMLIVSFLLSESGCGLNNLTDWWYARKYKRLLKRLEKSEEVTVRDIRSLNRDWRQELFNMLEYMIRSGNQQADKLYETYRSLHKD